MVYEHRAATDFSTAQGHHIKIGFFKNIQAHVGHLTLGLRLISKKKKWLENGLLQTDHIKILP
ncbi:hypothetical protein ACQP3F_31240, partial [Escherichia coli]